MFEMPSISSFVVTITIENEVIIFKIRIVVIILLVRALQEKEKIYSLFM